MRPLVSTIIPVFNRASMLADAVASVVAQTYRPIEIIVVDDGSTDGTPAFIEQLRSEHPEVRSLRIANGGPGAAREAGRQIATGEFIQYLDSDDLLLPERFNLLVTALEADPDAGVAYGMTRYTDMGGRELASSWKDPNRREQTMFPSFLRARWWDTPSALYRRRVTDAAGPWTTLRCEEDWEYDARIAALGTRLTFVPAVLAIVRFHDSHLSRVDSRNPDKLRDRAEAHRLIAAHAERAGIDRRDPAMRQFARELFHIARQCGAVGLVAESDTLVSAAVTIDPRADLLLYRTLGRILGWRRVARLSMLRDRFD